MKDQPSFRRQTRDKGLSQGLVIMEDMGGVSALQFAELAKIMAVAARAHGWTVPTFRSPPRRAGAHRTMRHMESGILVAVQLRRRTFFEVVVDMIDGVVQTNNLAGDEAAACRVALLSAVANLERIQAA